MAENQRPVAVYTGMAWGLLLILWGCTILFDSVPFGAGLIGTGLILFGANGVRAWNHLPARADNSLLGTLALLWGGLELARPVLHRLLGAADLDWAIFAMLLIALGLFVLGRALLKARRAVVETPQ